MPAGSSSTHGVGAPYRVCGRSFWEGSDSSRFHTTMPRLRNEVVVSCPKEVKDEAGKAEVGWLILHLRISIFTVGGEPKPLTCLSQPYKSFKTTGS